MKETNTDAVETNDVNTNASDSIEGISPEEIQTEDVVQQDNATEPAEIKIRSKSANLGADATLLTASKIATSAIAMIMTMLLSRFRTLGEYGTYKEILMVINLVTAILMLGLPKSLNYFLARADTDEERRKFLSFYYTLNSILSFIVGLALVLCIPLIELYFKNDTIRYFWYFLAVFPWTKIVCSSIENLLIVYKRAKMLVAFRILNSLALLSTVLFVRFLNWSFNEYMIMYVAVEAAFSIAVYIIAARISGGIRPYLSGKVLKTVLAFSVPLGLASVIGTLNIELDKLLIGKLMTTDDFAIYSNAAQELPVTLIASAFTAVLLPQMVRLLKKDRNRDAVRLWGNATTLSLIIIAIIGVGCFVYAEDVVTMLYGKKFVSGANVFRLYSLYLLLRCTYYGMVLNSIGKTRFIFWCSIGTLVSNAILNVVLFFTFRLFGQQMLAPAVATFISTVTMAYVQLHSTAKLLKLKFRELFPWKQIVVIILINAAFGAVFYLLKMALPLENIFSFKIKTHVVDGSAFESILLAAAWAILYFAVMFRTIKKKWKALKVKEN